VLVIVPLPVPALCTISCTGVARTPNVAVTLVFAVRATVHVDVPVQPPDQPVNVEVAFGAAVKVTAVPLLKPAVQVAPQLMPAGVLVIVPLPVPALCTVSCTGVAITPKVAVTLVFDVRSTVQVEMPLHPPDQPVNVEVAFGAAVRITDVPLLKFAVQVAPQLIPAGLLVIVPLPVPALSTVSCTGVATTPKVAVTLVFPIRSIVQVDVPLHPPDQPVNVEVAFGAAVRITDVPPLKLAVQVAPQLIPAGLLVIVPEPVPEVVTVNW
jgi:hypothetical protein